MPVRSTMSVLAGAALLSSCGAQPAPILSAPSLPRSAAEAGPDAGAEVAGPVPQACLQSWALEDAAGTSTQILVICGNDVRREPVTTGPMTRALDPALEVAHARVCACASRVHAPEFVDLVITAVPADGHASVEPGEPDAELDPAVAAGFIACVGSVPVSFARFAVDECGGQGVTTYVYSLDVQLEH